jgi:hypothetical protein
MKTKRTMTEQERAEYKEYREARKFARSKSVNKTKTETVTRKRK